MAFYSDTDINASLRHGEIICEPFNPANLSIASIDLRLDRLLYQIRRPWLNRLAPRLFPLPVVRPKIDENGRWTVSHNKARYQFFDLIDSSLTGQLDEFILYPGDFVLGNTIERIGSDTAHILADLADKSTPARLGLSICFSSGFVDPGNVLNPTLEIKNNGYEPITLQYGMHICQVRFGTCKSPASRRYDGKYGGARSVQPAR
jgi:deoxycytidine triphosphate deaminase